MKPIQIISQDLFDKIRSRFSNLEMGDEQGAVTIDPAEARFFDFDFIYEEKNLGRVSVSLNDPGTLKVYFSQGITENLDGDVKKIWYNFLKEMRFFSMRRLLRFDTRDISKTNLDKNDFQYLAANKPKDETAMNMNESRWSDKKSTKKTSRAVKGSTEVIVRHTESMDEMYPGARSHPKKIKAIFIQNKDGERFKYPFIHPAGAFAMAQHVDHGGAPYDAAGHAIIKMSEMIAQLQEFQRHVQRAQLNSDATGITERAVGRLQELKARVKALGQRKNYEAWIAEFNEVEHNDEPITELDPVQFEEYKQKFTQSNFNEELGKLFPLIHSIMQEKIDLEDYVKEEESLEEKAPEGWEGTVKAMKKHKDIDNPWALAHWMKGKGYKSHKKADEEFESWAEAVEQGGLDMSEIEQNLQGRSLSDALGQISLGPDGSVAWNELSAIFGLDERDSDDEALKDQLEAKAKTADQTMTGMDSPAMDVFKSWVEDKFPQWKQDLPDLFGQEPSAEQPPAEAPPAEEPAAPEQPQPPTVENDDAVWTNNTMPVQEGQGDWIKETAKLVKSRYNASNESVGPFTSPTAVCLDVKKAISEKFGEQVGEKAYMVAEKFIAKLTQEWEQKFQKSTDELAPVEDDGLARLKELLGTVKAKVEGLSKDKPEEFSPKHTDPKPEKSDPKLEMDKSQTPPGRDGGDDDAGKKQYTGTPTKFKDTATDAEKALNKAFDKKDEGMAEGEMSAILKLAGLTK